ncbi:uncharacterized protein LOC109512121 [Hippocampus comes]|uniref:uncharacterized protein LOC109512121 n=1 Tax=Hippocampus comes TaxID=109280 RepID=UPI00094E8967|nr:PREDICTED: uncharacterized protein LOC109512121 [Hippocampus comes]
MNSVANWLVDNKDKIEKGVDIIGQASEVLAATVGQLHPILEAVFMASAEILSNPEGKEAVYLSQKIEQVNQKLVGIQTEIDQIALELQRASMNKQNVDREAHILGQYEKFQEFINTKPSMKEKKKDKFIKYYENTEADLNLEALYNAVTGENTAGDPMLDTVVTTEQRSRRAVEDFCARLKKLFVVGLIAVMGYAALKEGANWFELTTDNKIRVVVSFCVDPQPIDKTRIYEQIEQQRLKGNMMAVALTLNRCFPDCLVHAVSHYKEVVESNNFSVESYYYGKHKRAFLCIHPQ